MVKKRIILTIIALIIFVSKTQNVHAATLVVGKRIHASITQKAINEISIQQAAIENMNPETYQVTLVKDYYTIKTYDQNKTELWSGQIPNTLFFIADADPHNPVAYEYSIPESLTLNLPYHSESKYVRIYSEQGKMLLEINLDLFSITSTDKFAQCDECGYCKGANPPQNWQACRECLYPGSNSDHLKGDTLLINPSTDKSAFRGNGRAFTDFGCLVSPAGFTSAEGRASTVQFFMRVVYTVTGAIAMIAILYGAFLIMTAKADQEQIGRGKRLIYRAIIGTVIIYLGVFLISFIGANILRLPGFGR